MKVIRNILLDGTPNNPIRENSPTRAVDIAIEHLTKYANLAGRLAGVLQLAIERMEASLPSEGGATEKTIRQCKSVLRDFNERNK